MQFICMFVTNFGVSKTGQWQMGQPAVGAAKLVCPMFISCF